MLLFISISVPHSNAAEFDTLLSETIADKGVYDGRNGVIFATKCENNSMLAIIYTENLSLVANIYGNENEKVDSLTVSLGNKKNCHVLISGNNEPLCITISENKSKKHYRLINDSFTQTDIGPVSSTPIFKYINGKAKTEVNTDKLIRTKNILSYERAENLPFREIELTDKDKADILLLLKACADIYTYDSTDYDLDSLTLKILHTHRNFSVLSKINPESSENTTIKMCSERFISDAMYKAFRITPDKPALNMLTTTGYCYNNKLYYYTGGYDKYFATNVKEIVKTYAIRDNSVYVIFKNSYTDSSTPINDEYSCATIKKDNNGYYLTSLSMGKLIDNPQTIISPDTVSEAPDIYKRHLPLLILLLAIAAIGVVVYLYIL